MQPYPLLFQPEFKERVWGGRALEQYGFKLPQGPIGEGWMIGDHPHGTTKVINGPLAGLGLDEVRLQFGKTFFGSNGFSSGRFPLLVKLLDCEDNLSIQVHPSDDYAGLPDGESGKTEMWYVLAAKPDAKIIYGLNPGVTPELLTEAIEKNRILDCLRQVSVSAGDSFYIPAGTVHALGAGILVAEVQQNSDTVYRLYDYNRPGLDGKPRELHLKDSLNVIAFEGAGATRMTTQLPLPNQWLTLVNSPFFVVEKGRTEDQWPMSTTDESFVILVVCEGTGTLHWNEPSGDQSISVKPGDCFLLPANLGSYNINGNLTLIRSYLA